MGFERQGGVIDPGPAIGRAHALGQPQGGDAINSGVVHLGVNGELPVLQSLDQVHLPQGPAAVQ